MSNSFAAKWNEILHQPIYSSKKNPVLQKTMSSFFYVLVGTHTAVVTLRDDFMRREYEFRAPARFKIRTQSINTREKVRHFLVRSISMTSKWYEEAVVPWVMQLTQVGRSRSQVSKTWTLTNLWRDQDWSYARFRIQIQSLSRCTTQPDTAIQPAMHPLLPQSYTNDQNRLWRVSIW